MYSNKSVELLNTSIGSNLMDKQQQMINIDDEIAEIEELISLQRRKVELLRKKNTFLKKDDSGNTDNYALRKETSSNSNPMQVPFQSESAKFGDNVPPNSPTSNSSKQLSLISSMQRMSRLSTDLANERNLLAWGRTAMAAARTALAFLGLVGNNDFGVGLVYTTSIGFGVIAVWMMIQGSLRYKQIKNILLLPEPPIHFGRLSNNPIVLVLVVLLVLLVIGNSADSWSK